MQIGASRVFTPVPAAKSWSRSRALRICPRRYLRVLPGRTRPGLFGDD